MGTNKILWADDDADDLMLMKEILSKHQVRHELVVAANGKEAIDYLNQAKADNSLPCLVIMDINMPVMDGKEAISILKRSEDFQSLPIVVFTTSNSELDKLYCKKMKVEMITKPPSYRTLERTVLNMISHCKD